MTIADKQHYETEASNYIDRASSVDSITGGKIFRKAVHSGNDLLDLKIVCSAGVNTWGLTSDSKRVALGTKRGGSTYGESTCIMPTLYVLNSSGNPIEWTGVFGLCDIDGGSAGEQMRIQPKNIIKLLHQGSNISIDDVNSDWKRVKGSGSADTSTAMYNTNAAYYKVTIPTSGMALRYFKTNSSYEAWCILDLYEGKSMVDGLTFAQTGTWKSM